MSERRELPFRRRVELLTLRLQGRLDSAGADRVVIGTAAVEDPSLVEELCGQYGGHRVVVALDARDGRVAIKGWTQGTDLAVMDLARQMRNLGVPRLLYTDMKTYLVELLMKQDQMSMAASIESRVPFLDHLLVEFAATMPTECAPEPSGISQTQ